MEEKRQREEAEGRDIRGKKERKRQRGTDIGKEIL
jgi:hypothetical protein